jgi:hypothetical protein
MDKTVKTIKIAHIYCSSIERTYYGKKIKPSVESSLKGVRGKPFFPRKFSPQNKPFKKIFPIN